MGCLGEASAPAAAPPIEEAPKDEVPTAADCEEAPTAASATAPPAPPAPAPMQRTGSKARFDLATRSLILPQGATPFFLHLAIGVGLLVVAGLVLVVAIPRPGRAV